MEIHSLLDVNSVEKHETKIKVELDLDIINNTKTLKYSLKDSIHKYKKLCTPSEVDDIKCEVTEEFCTPIDFTKNFSFNVKVTHPKKYSSAFIKFECKDEFPMKNQNSKVSKPNEPVDKIVKVKQTSADKDSCDNLNYNIKNDKATQTEILNSLHGVLYTCNRCDFKAKSKENFKIHIDYSQRNVQYPCDQCDYKATRRGHLKTHINSVHGRYPCYQCDYKSRWNGNLMKHIKSIHGDVPYACNQCEYKAKGKGNLKRHRKIHMTSVNGESYSCGECDYHTSFKESLKMHMDSVHEDEQYPLD